MRKYHPAFIIIAASTAALSTPARAEKEKSFTIEQTFEGHNEAIPPDLLDSTAAQDRIIPGLSSHTTLAYEIFDRKTGEQLLLDTTVSFSVYPDNDEVNRYGFHNGIQYRFAVGGDKNWQVRLRGQHSYFADNDRRVFQRGRIGAQVAYRGVPDHVTRAHVRLGYRDQNDATFTGYDQSEVLVELGHDWRPGKGMPSLSATAFGDFRNADADRFSYDGYGLRLGGRIPVAENWGLYGKMLLTRREYGDIFSLAKPIVRKDTRIWPRAGLQHQISDNVYLFGEVGYDINDSNIAMRDYKGVTALIGITFSEDIWRSDD